MANGRGDVNEGGKRKSGKDYLVDRLEEGWKAASTEPLSVMRLSAPLKGEFARREGILFGQ